MSRIAIIDSTTLLGKEVRETLERRSGHHDLVLLTTDENEVGAVTEAYGGAALVLRAEPEALRGVDLLVACGPVAATRALIAGREPGTTALVLSPDARPADGRAVVAGWNDAGALPGEHLRSPHPAAVALAHLALPLVPLGLVSITATLVQPASHYGQAALEDLFTQTRNIVAMTASEPSRFGRQLAFNLFPAPDVAPGAVASALAELGFPARVPLAVQVLQGGLFHGLAASVHARFGPNPPAAAAIEAALEAAPHVEIDRGPKSRPGMPGPVEAANEEGVIVGGVRAEPGSPGAFWIWAVMDNLTRGGALNAVDVANQILGLPRA
jgi:aspartate-semialdehyde dehydrogenase